MTITLPGSRILLAAAACACAALSALPQSNPSHSATYLGGSSNLEAALAVAVAANGDLIVAGSTESADFPVTAGAFDGRYGGAGDAFVARLSPDGSRVLAATYLGGSSRDEAVFVHEAGDGSIWVGGTTASAGFPTTPDAFSMHAGGTDAFVASFDANLGALLYGTTFGGPDPDTGKSFVVDGQNRLVYLAGTTGGFGSGPGTTVPTTSTAVQRNTAGHRDLYVAVLDRNLPGTTTLAYGTLVGGSTVEVDLGSLTLEGNGVLTLSGRTISTDFPTTPNAVQATGGGSNEDGVIARIDTQANGAAGLLYASYIGGSGPEQGIRHATDPAGVVHLLLTGPSPDLPVTGNALIPTPSGNTSDAYYAQIDPSGSGAAGLRYGSWILTVGSDIGRAIGHRAGKVAMFLQTSQFGQLTTAGAFMRSAHGGTHGYLVELDVSSRPDPFISHATHYVGCGQVHPQAMAYDGNEVVLGGRADGAPVTPGAAQLQNSNLDAFVGRLELRAWPSPFSSFGTACAGTAGAPQMVGRSPARLCRTLVLRATGLLPNGAGILFAGFDRTQFQGTPLPLSLAALGAPGCEILVGPEIVLLRFANASGDADLSVAIPEDPGLLGTVLFSQFALVDMQANPLGLVTTNGLGAEVRW